MMLHRKSKVLTAIVLNFRTPEQTLQALRGLDNAADGIEIEKIVVDNASKDGSVGIIQVQQPDTQIIELQENCGFSIGMNVGLRAASGEYILLLNSDIEPEPGSVSKMLGFMHANSDIGLVAPLLFNAEGNLSRSVLMQPAIWQIFLPVIIKLRHKLWHRRIGDKPLDVEATEGAAIMISRKTLEQAGGLDEDFFFYAEIVEWCMRIRERGLRVVILPMARMKHLEGGSTDKYLKASRIELKRSEYLLFRKRMGVFMCWLAIMRDIVFESIRCLEYGLLTALSFGMWSRVRHKLSAHSAILKWMTLGMPDRQNPRYISSFGAWN